MYKKDAIFVVVEWIYFLPLFSFLYNKINCIMCWHSIEIQKDTYVFVKNTLFIVRFSMTANRLLRSVKKFIKHRQKQFNVKTIEKFLFIRCVFCYTYSTHVSVFCYVWELIHFMHIKRCVQCSLYFLMWWIDGISYNFGLHQQIFIKLLLLFFLFITSRCSRLVSNWFNIFFWIVYRCKHKKISTSLTHKLYFLII